MLEKIIIKLNSEELLNLSISKKERLLLIVDESYSYPENLLSEVIKSILNLLTYFYWEDFCNLGLWNKFLITHSDFVTGELDITLGFDYKDQKLEYFFNILESKFIMESVSINGKPAYFIENSFGNQYKCESFEEYQKISKLSNKNYPTYYIGSNLKYIDKLFNKLVNDIVTSEKSIHEYNDRVKNIYKQLVPKLDLGITRVDISGYGATYYVGCNKNEIRMSLNSLGSGMNTLAKSLPQAIDAIVNNKTYILSSDGLDSIHPILSKALILLFNKYKRGRLIMPSWSIPLDRLEFYNLKESNILKLRSKTPETLIYE